MALKVKAVERLLKFSNNENDPGVYRYVLKPDLYTSLSQAKVIKEAALRSGVSRGVMQACWDAAGEVIKAWATEGHSVALPGLGTMRFGLRSKAVEKVEDVKTGLIESRRIIFTPDVRSKAVEKVEDVKTGLIESRRIIFTPDVDLKDELKNTAIQITCYDRDGKEVKRVTSTDPGTIEDPENDNQNGGSTENGNTGGNTSGDNNGGNTGGGGDGGDDLDKN